MIKFDVKMPSKVHLMRVAMAMAEVEKQVAKTARSAAAFHGGVNIRFERKADGSIRSVDFQGSEAALKATKAAILK